MRFLVTLLALMGGLLLAEGFLRWLLFSDGELAQRWGARYRDAGLYVPTTYGDEYAKLHFLLTPPDARWKPGNPHPELGWIKSTIDPSTLLHADLGHLGERRPLLLYGSSFAACSGATGSCFEDLLERTDLSSRFSLLNYAVTAFGLDQAMLMLARTLEHYAELDPVVVMGFVVESDLERLMMSFYFAPKPRFLSSSEDRRLVLPDMLDPAAYVERHPPQIASYLLRYLVHGVHVLPSRVARLWFDEGFHALERRALTGHLLLRLHRELEQRGIEHFVFLFHSEQALPPVSQPHPDEEALLSFLEQERIPYVDSRRVLLEELPLRGIGAAALFSRMKPGQDHPNALGCEVLFQGLARGLARRYDNADALMR